MITSASNRKIKEVTALLKKSSARKEQGLFVVEGIKMITEIPEGRLAELYLSESFCREVLPEQCEILHRKGIGFAECLPDPAFARGTVQAHSVCDDVFEKMSDTATPQGILAIVRMPNSVETAGRIEKSDAVLFLDRLQDPGNLGTILRMSEAAGIDALIMSRDTADIFNPKVVRSTMGSVFRVPFAYTDDLCGEIRRWQKRGMKIYAAHLDGKNSYDKEDYRASTGFIIGNESKGISEEVAACADCLIRIPMSGAVESLNAAMAATVLAFELARQRR